MPDIELTKEYAIFLQLDSETLTVDNNCIINFFFVEDIFSFTITGKLVMVDKYGIVEYGSLSGNEKIILKYGRDYEKELEFDMIKVSEIQQSKSNQPTRENTIEINFADTTFEMLVRRKYSRSWKETKISDIVKHIFKNWLPKVELSQWEDNNEKIDLVLPWFTPYEVLKLLSKKGVGAKTGSSGFVIYHSTENNFSRNYVSLDYLFNGNPYLDPLPYMFETENPFYINKILNWSISSVDKFSHRGIKGGHRFGYDFELKKFYDEDFKYREDISKITMMGKKTLFKDISDDRANYEYHAEPRPKDIKDHYYADWIKRYNLQQALTIHLRGNEDRFAGMHIEIEWASSDTSQLFNKMWKGKWLVKSVTHRFNTNKNTNMPYIQKLVLLKNAYNDIDHNSILKSKKMYL